MREKIKRKLYLGFAIVLAITVVISGFGLANIRSINESYVYAFSHPMERFNILTQISVRMLDSGGLVPTIVLRSQNTEAINHLTLETDSNHYQLLDYANTFRHNVYMDSRLNDTETASLIHLMDQTEELFIQFKEQVIDPVIAAAHIGDMPAIDNALALDAQLRAQIYERHTEMVAEAEETLANVRLDAENATNIVTWMLIVFAAAGIALGLIVAIFTSGLIGKATDKEHEAKLRQQQIYDANPIPASLWNENQQIIACNNAMVKLLGMSDKDDYTERFYEFTPKFQQDGTRTLDKVAEISEETNKTGYCRTPFTHLSSEKETVPCDVIAVKIELDSETLHAVYVQDMRPTLEATAKLQESEKRTRDLMDACPLAVALFDERWKELSSNHTAIDMFGLNENYDYSKPPDYFISEGEGADSDEIYRKVREEVAQNGRYQAKILVRKLDGTPLPVEATYVRLDYGDHYLIAAYYRDLTEEKDAKEREREANEAIHAKESMEIAQQRMTAMLNASPLACFVLDDSFNVLDLNREAINLFMAENKQDFIENFIRTAPEYQLDGEPSAKKMYELMASSMEYIRTEWTAQTFQGEQFPCELHATRFFNDGVKMVIVHMRDLRDFYAYQEMSERIQVMFDTTPLIIEYWDENYMPVDCNKANLDFFGLSKEQYKQYIEEIRFNSPIPGNIGDSHRSGWDANIKKIFETGFGRFEWTEPKPDGTNAPLEVEGYRMMLNNKPIVVTYSRDVTELRNLQKEEQRARIAEESNRAKTMFLANMSHEIRTPMNSILGYSELALDDTISDTTREHLEKIVTNTKWLLAVINDVLDISKIESGNLELEQMPFNINQVMEHCQSLLQASAKPKGLTLNFAAPKIEGKLLLGDPTKLCQVCINLMSNAIKFTDSGLVSLSIAVAEFAEKSVTLNFEIRDTGVGMTAEQVSRVFEPFIQADSSTTRKHGGTGLGLPITKRLIEAMGGELAVESVPGLGSKFSFTLTFGAVEAGTDSVGSYLNEEAEIAKPHFTGGDILVVDDNNMNLGVICEHLKRVGLKSFIAKDGNEAVEAVKQRMTGNEAMFDLIFMDIHMPVMDGKEAARVISGFNIGVPIVAMTAETIMLTDDAPYIDFGMEGYLSKPFTTQELWKCLLRYLIQ